jgi:hypothetical protein
VIGTYKTNISKKVIGGQANAKGNKFEGLKLSNLNLGPKSSNYEA